MAAHTHWRITCDGLDYVQLAEVAFLSAGLTDLSVGGTASASSEYSAAFPASAAFDKDASGSWWCTAPGSLPAWLAYAHPTAVEPVYVRITSHTAYPPISLGLQHSDDGITWSAAVPLIFSSGGPIASGAATVFVPSVGSRPIVWQSNEVRELPAGDKLPADVIPSHGHAMGDVAGLDAALGAKEASIAAGATTQYFRGDKTWRTFMTDVRATTLSGLSTATNAVIAAGDTVLTALGKLQAQVTGHTGASSGAHAATAISNTPAGGIAATNVQAAINELDSEKYPKTGGNISGDVIISPATGRANLYGVTSDADAAGQAALAVQASATGSVSASAEKRVGIMSFTTSGSTAGHRGGTWSLATKADNSASIVDRLTADHLGNVLAVSGALGYGAGAGGTVTQATSKSTTVTLNKPSGLITMHNASLAAGASVSFILACSYASAPSNATTTVSVVNGSVVSGLNYRVEAASSTGGGVFIRLTNITGSALAEAVQIQFNTHAGSST